MEKLSEESSDGLADYLTQNVSLPGTLTSLKVTDLLDEELQSKGPFMYVLRLSFSNNILLFIKYKIWNLNTI